MVPAPIGQFNLPTGGCISTVQSVEKVVRSLALFANLNLSYRRLVHNFPTVRRTFGLMFTNCGSMFGLNLDNGQLPSPPPPAQQAPLPTQPPLTNSLVSCPSTTTLLPVATAPPPTLLASALFPQSVNAAAAAAAGRLSLFPFLARPNLHMLSNHGGGGSSVSGNGGGSSGGGSSAFGYSGTLWTSGEERRGSAVDRPVTLADVIAQLQKVSNTPLSVKESQPIRKKHRPCENFTCPICGEEVAEKLIEQHFEKESQNLEKRFIKLNATIKFESNFNATTEGSNLELGCSGTEAERNSTGRYEMFCRIRINRESRLRGKLTGFRYYTSTHMPIDIQKEEDIESYVTEEKANSNSPFSCDSTELSTNEQQLNPQLINEPDIDVENMQATEQIDESPHSVESSDSETVHSPYQILNVVSTTAEAATTATTTTTTTTT
ncbi:Protein Teyrha-meyrha [Trichinella spiralis]|uniref:Protein Teyrha-meyrha n=1 Tax=Trichinella spiralis TaxID=6334 RepID=A0ABR3L2E4_TRISP